LAALVDSEPAPEEIRPIIAEIVRGNRKPNKKAAAKLKLPAEERMKIAGSVSVCLGLIDALKFDAIDAKFPGLRGASYLAESEHARGRIDREPVEIVRNLEGESRNVYEMGADDLGVSTETIEDLVRDMRRKMESFPSLPPSWQR